MILSPRAGSSTALGTGCSLKTTGCDPSGENSCLIIGIERDTGGVAASAGLDAVLGSDRNPGNGIKVRSSAVVLTSTGELISSSLLFDELRVLDADRFDASFSFRPLKSAKIGVEGMRGDVDALLACRTTFGERKASAGGYVADRGVHGDGKGMAYVSEHAAPNLGEGTGFRGAGGTGVRYLSLGFRVKEPEDSDLVRLCSSLGISSTLRRCPGSKGQTVVDGSEGL